MCGIRTSSRTRSGFVLPTSGSTCVPVCVSPTISKPPSASSARLIPSRTSRWSSAITTRTGTSVAQGPDAASGLTRLRHREGPRPGEPVRPGHRSRPSSEGLLLPKSGDTLRRRQRTGPIALEARGGAHGVRIEFKQRRENGDGEGGYLQAAGAGALVVTALTTVALVASRSRARARSSQCPVPTIRRLAAVRQGRSAGSTSRSRVRTASATGRSWSTSRSATPPIGQPSTGARISRSSRCRQGRRRIEPVRL